MPWSPPGIRNGRREESSGRNHRPSSPTAAFAEADLQAVRDELEVCRSEVRDCRDLGGDTAGVVAEILPRLDELQARLTNAEAQLAAALAQPKTSRNAPLHWPILSPAQAELRWAELAEWVAAILVDWYEITRAELPDCWPLHHPAVVELSWLRTSYIQAYQPMSPPQLTAEWHTRWRPAALANIAAAIPTEWCRPGEHLIHELDMTSRPRNTTNQPLDPSPFGNSQVSERPGNGGQNPQSPARQRAASQHWWPCLQEAVVDDMDRRHRAETANRPRT